MDKRKLYARVLGNTVVAILILLLVIFVVPKLVGFFLPFIIGWMIAMIANPLVGFMEKKVKILRKHSSAIIIIFVLAAIVGLVYLMGVLVMREIRQFLNDLPALYENLQEGLQLFAGKFSGLNAFLPKSSQQQFEDISKNLTQTVAQFVSNVQMLTITQAGNVAKNIIDGLFSLIVTILSAYFFIAERDQIVKIIRTNTPSGLLEKFDMVLVNFKRAFGGYMKAQFKIMLVIWVILFIGFAIMGVDYSFLLALVVAFIDLLPFFGTGIVLTPWVIYELVIGEFKEAIILIVIYLVCQVVKQILQPKMVGDSIGMSPLATLFFMFIGYRLGDFIGLIIGIPVGMVLINFYKSGVFDSLIQGFKLVSNDLEKFLKIQKK